MKYLTRRLSVGDEREEGGALKNCKEVVPFAGIESTDGYTIL